MAYSGPSPNPVLFPGFSFSAPDIQVPHVFDFQSNYPSGFNTSFAQATENSSQGLSMAPTTFSTELESQASNALIEQTEVSVSTQQAMQEDESGAYERQQLSSMKGAAIRSLWTSFQRVATNLSSLVAGIIRVYYNSFNLGNLSNECI